jgi:hypothetical protein
MQLYQLVLSRKTAHLFNINSGDGTSLKARSVLLKNNEIELLVPEIRTQNLELCIRVKWTKLPHWPLMPRRTFLQNFNTREQHMLLSGKAFSSESGNVEAIAIVYFSKF